MNIYNLIRPLLFSLPAETAHDLVLNLLPEITEFLPAPPQTKTLETTVAGIRFPNPLGLAAGMDKNAIALPLWRALGFGFVEIGTVTPEPQVGNPRPRMFRLVEDRSIINRMGFNNDGAEVIAERLQKLAGTLDFPVGISVGKQVTTPLEHAGDDHRSCLQTLYPFGDYFVINISSPNTTGLRRLQGKEYATELFLSGMEDCQGLARRYMTKTDGVIEPKLLFVKISPDLSPEELEDVILAIKASGINGVIATNTTLGRDGLESKHREEKGGASGPLLLPLSTHMVRVIRSELPEIPIIGGGGIQRADDIVRFRSDLYQIYTGLIYKGPRLVREILEWLEADRQK